METGLFTPECNPLPLVYHTSHTTTETPINGQNKLISTQNLTSSDKNSRSIDHIFIPHVSVNPRYLAFYDIPAGGRKNRTAAQMEAEKYLRDNRTDGIISKKSNSRINNIVGWFTALATHKRSEHEKRVLHYRLTFVTLTLPSKQMHDDNFIKRNLLNRFIIKLTRSFQITNYFWRAEAQENGNIHFHLLIDKYIHYLELRKEWNKILKDFGYIENYQNKMLEFFKVGFRMSDNPNDKRTKEQQIAAYNKGKETNFSDPNSTDIHSLKFVNNIAAYVAKYCAKNNRYFEVKAIDAKTLHQQIKKLSETFDVRIKKDSVQFAMKRTDDNKNLNIYQILADAKVIFTEAREKEIREIKGRLWYASDSVLQMKNFVTEVTSEVFKSITHIIDNAKGKFVKVSDYCTLFMFDVLNTTFDPDEVKGLFDPLFDHCKLQRLQLN